jgi:TRAP-type C4-dicarboxylate transport system substrate-binding protein
MSSCLIVNQGNFVYQYDLTFHALSIFQNILKDAYSFDVPYLFQTDKFYDQSFDMGK